MAKAVVAALLMVLSVGMSPVLGAQAAPPTANRWIVQVQPTVSVGDVIGAAQSRWGIVAGQRFARVLHGFAIGLTQSQRDALATDPRVTAIVPDVPVQATGSPYPTTTEEIQPGIRRVGATTNLDRQAAKPDVDIAVLDTGIQPDNTELNIAGGYDCTDPTESEVQRADPANWADSAGFGHGTHVSGIAAAIENRRGVAGVAQGARLWAIKVLDGNGNGYWSWVICGLDHVAQMRDPKDSALPRIEVANMSLASAGWDDGDCGHSNADLLHQAICRLSDAGVTMVAAAGNWGRDASGYVPAAYGEVITVSAMADWNGHAAGSGTPPTDCIHANADDAFASFSNYGSDVDLIAPGVCVFSTMPVDQLGLMSGTSMATPHVTGGAALYYLEEARRGRPRPTPQQVRAALIATGTANWQTSTDPDRGLPGSAREPALNVSDLSLSPSFQVGLKRQIVRASAGSRVHDDLWVARLGGFSGSPSWQIDSSSLPPGSDTTFGSGPTLTIDLPANATPGAYTVLISAAAAGETEHAAFKLIVYDSSADEGGPVITLRSGMQAGQVTLPIDVTWPRVTGAQRYQLQQSIDESVWATIAEPRGTKLSTSAWPGTRYRYQVRAKVGGVWRSWQTGPSAVVYAYEPSTALHFSGSWQSARIKHGYSELPFYSTRTGSSANFDFTGTSVAWIATRTSDRGRATITIDGAPVATIDLHSSSKQNRMLVYARSWSSAGAHTLRIDVLGIPASRPRVDVDALVVVAN